MALMPLSIILNNSGKGYLLQCQNSCVSHLVYMDDIKLFASSRQHLDSLLTTLSLFSDDICMQFGCSKCNILTLTRGCMTQQMILNFLLFLMALLLAWHLLLHTVTWEFWNLLSSIIAI